MKHAFALLLWIIVAATAAPVRCADDEPKTSQDDKVAAQRLKLMRDAIDGFRITSKEIEPEAALKFSARPLLRYNDQTRSSQNIKGVLDATAWRLGETGRPKAVVTLEIYLVEQARPLLTYEFVSLTPKTFEMQSVRGVRWLPHETDLSMTGFAEAPRPADTPRARLVQMRALSRRFTAQEELGAGKSDLRLLTQPIDRYEDLAAGILDGAAFVFANGTNPEMGLLVECSEEKWSYGLFRLASAKLLAQLDGKSVMESTKPPGYPVDASYTATRHSVTLPAEHDGE